MRAPSAIAREACRGNLMSKEVRQATNACNAISSNKGILQISRMCWSTWPKCTLGNPVNQGVHPQQVPGPPTAWCQLPTAAKRSAASSGTSQPKRGLPSHQPTWKCKKALSKRKVVLLQGSVHKPMLAGGRVSLLSPGESEIGVPCTFWTV